MSEKDIKGTTVHGENDRMRFNKKYMIEKDIHFHYQQQKRKRISSFEEFEYSEKRSCMCIELY